MLRLPEQPIDVGKGVGGLETPRSWLRPLAFHALLFRIRWLTGRGQPHPRSWIPVSSDVRQLSRGPFTKPHTCLGLLGSVHLLSCDTVTVHCCHVSRNENLVFSVHKSICHSKVCLKRYMVHGRATSVRTTLARVPQTTFVFGCVFRRKTKTVRFHFHYPQQFTQKVSPLGHKLQNVRIFAFLFNSLLIYVLFA